MHWPNPWPVMELGCPSLVGAGVLPVQKRSAPIVLASISDCVLFIRSRAAAVVEDQVLADGIPTDLGLAPAGEDRCEQAHALLGLISERADTDLRSTGVIEVAFTASPG